MIEEVCANLVDENLVGRFCEYVNDCGAAHIRDTYANLLQSVILNCTDVYFSETENEKKEVGKTLEFEIKGRRIKFEYLSKGLRKVIAW